MKWKNTLLNSGNVVNHDVISFRDYVFFVFFGGGGGGGGVLRHWAVQTNFEWGVQASRSGGLILFVATHMPS